MASARTLILRLALLAGAGLSAAPAHAQNLVKDGGFELANPTVATLDTTYYSAGSSFDGGLWNVTQGTAGIDTANDFVYAGDKSLFLDADDSNPTAVAQTLATLPGQKYTLSFYADADYSPSTLNVSFGNTVLSPITVPGNDFNTLDDNPGFTHYTFTVAADSASTDLIFSTPDAVNNVGGTLEIDDVSVSPVPEASSVISLGLLLALGLSGVAVARRRKATAGTF